MSAERWDRVLEVLGFFALGILWFSILILYLSPLPEQRQKPASAPTAPPASAPALQANAPALTGMFPHLSRDYVRAYFEILAQNMPPNMEARINELPGKVSFDDVTFTATDINGNSFTLTAYVHKGTSRVGWVEANGMFITGTQDKAQARRSAEAVYRTALDLVVRGSPIEVQVRQWVKANLPKVRARSPLVKDFGQLRVEIYGAPPHSYTIELKPTTLEAYLAKQMMKDLEAESTK